MIGIKWDSLQEIPIPSDVPVLLLGGEIDPITPPENMVRTAEYLRNSVTINIPDNGHWLNRPECMDKMITEFLRDAKLPGNKDDCPASTQKLAFVQAVSYNKGIADIGNKVLMGKEKQVYVPLLSILNFVLIGFIGIPVLALIRRLRKKQHSSKFKLKTPWEAWFLTLSTVVFIGLLYLAISSTLERNYYILGFGILSRWNWIFFVVPFILGLLLYFLWQRKIVLNEDAKRLDKFLTFCSLAGTISFIGLLLYWNVLWPFSN
jgi:hypothetical protein